MKKRTIIFICIILALLFIAGAVLMMCPYLKNRIYAGDRITGTFSMTVEGKAYSPTDETLEYENTGTQRLKNDGAGNFSIKGGQYGGYKLGFILENDRLFELTQDPVFTFYDSNPTLTFFYINANWWHVTEMILAADMRLSDGQWIVDCKVVYKESTESDGFKDETVEKSFSYDEIITGNGTIQFGL